MTDTPPDREEALADALEDMHRRRARGEDAIPDDYRGRLGDSHEDFMKIVAAETRLDGTLAPAPAEALPRPFAGFTLLREIGRGASGVVYEAVDRRLGRTVALKILRTGVDTDSTALERFRREAKACAHVRHDHIVAIHEAGETDGRPWYSMDLVPGEPLSSAVRGGERLDPKLLAAGVAGVADGLHALHAAGIVHRDVKPQNLIVRPDGQMILADFGLARSAQAVALTQTGDALGTPLYMSPEQMLGQKGEVDARTDVYGLGATMYEALCGRPVFRTEDVASLMRMILTQRPDPVRAHAPSVPADLEGIVMKCLEKRKGDRYPSAAALADDLRAFVKGEPVLGRPVGHAVRTLRAARRRWLSVALAASALLAAGAWWYLRPGYIHYAGLPGIPFAVTLDGVLQGDTPITVRIGRGKHDIVLEHPFIKPIVETRRAAGGEDVWPPLPQLEARPGFEEKAGGLMKELTGAIRLPPTEPPDVSGTRGGHLTELYVPQGDVRAEDVTALVAKLPEGLGVVRVARGTEILWEYKPKDLHEYWIEVPAAVRARLRVGDEVRWGWYPTDDGTQAPTPPTEATFRVVDRTVRDLDPAFRAAVVPGVANAYRVQALRDAKLPTAAFLAAYEAAERQPEARSAWTPLLWSLKDLLSLKDLDVGENDFALAITEWIGPNRKPADEPPLLRPVPK